MDISEMKLELYKIITEADEETTDKLFKYARQFSSSSKFSQEELNDFHITRQKYLSSEHQTISLTDAHLYIRSLKQK